MRKWLLCLAAILFSGPCYAGFEMLQVSTSQPAAVTCTITTGTCTGTGGGSSLFTAATCNGVADDVAAFTSFNSWAVSTWQASHSGLIELDIPHGANCLFHGTGNCSNGSSCPSDGIIQLRIVGLGYSGNGDGATFSTDAGSAGFFLGSFRGEIQDNAHSARLISSNVGDSCVTLVTSAQASLFTAGNYVLISGVDMQQNATQGFPVNPYYYEYPQISTVDSVHKCDGTTSGASVHFTAGLANKYLSTWPIFNAGGGFEIDQGGPSTLYALNAGWNTTQSYIGLTFASANSGGQLYAIGRNITYQNVKFTNANCPIPTQNYSFTITNFDLSTCDMEVDKVNTTVTLHNGTINQLNFQSATPDQFNLNNVIVSSSIQGTPKNFACTGSTIASLTAGAHSFGRSSVVDLGNCAVASFGYSAVVDQGDGDGTGGTSNPGFNRTREMSGGVIKHANSVNITNAVDQGSGVLRLTVACNTSLYPTCTDATTAFTVGLYYELGNLFMGASFSGSTSGTTLTAASVSGTIQINSSLSGTSVPNGTTITAQLTGPTGGAGTYTLSQSAGTISSEAMTSGKGQFGNYTVAAKSSGAQTVDINLNESGLVFVGGGLIGGALTAWYIPGTNMSWNGQLAYESAFWQVTTLTQDGNWVYIGTTLAGGFPTVPTYTCGSGSGCIAVTAHPAPVFKCSGCSGDVNMVGMGADPSHGPAGSYFKRTFVDGSSTAKEALVMGNISSVDANVTAAQGSANTFGFGELMTNSSGTISNWTPLVNVNSVGDRHITLSGSTCTSGTCTGDSGLAPPDSTLSFLATQGFAFTGSTTGSPVSVTITTQLNQGVVYPPNFP